MFIATLDPIEVQVMKDALTLFATQCEKNDSSTEAQISDKIWSRLDALTQIDSEQARQWMRHAGVGPWRQKPQG